MRYDVLRGEFTSYLGGINASNVEFSRNGEGVIYITQPDLVLWLARADGSDARRLTPASMQIANAAGSPDGKWIAFRGRSGGDTHTKIYLMPYTGGPATPLIPEDVEQGAPSWSADSRRIAYGDVPEAFGRSTGSEVIHVYDRATHEFASLPGSKLLWSSRWSPDGKYVAALTIKGQALMLHDVATGQWRPLGVDHVGARQPVHLLRSRVVRRVGETGACG